MDKNTLKMLLVMALVIFGFSFIFNKPKQQNKKEDTSENVTDSASATVAVKLDTLPTGYISKAKDNLLSTAPNAEEATFTKGIATLTANRDTVYGTVKLSDDVTLSYADVVNRQFPAEMDTVTRNRATNAVKDLLDEAAKYGPWAALRQDDGQAADEVTLGYLANGDSTLVVTITPRGGYITSATLNNYKSYAAHNEGLPVKLFSGQDYGFILNMGNSNKIDTRELMFTPVIDKIDEGIVDMTAKLSDEAELTFRYTIHPEEYIVSFEVIQRGLNDPTYNINYLTKANLVWNQTMPRLERGNTFEDRNSSVYYKLISKKPKDLNGMKSESKDLNGKEMEWIAFKNQFFSTIFIPKSSFRDGEVVQKCFNHNPEVVKTMAANTDILFSTDNEVALSIDIFMGPNLYPLLKGLDKFEDKDDLYLTRVIPLGWSWCRWINTLIVIPVFNFLSEFISNYGIIILLLTIFIKIIIFPFTYKSYLSQAKMRLLAPEIKEINDQYPGKENAMIRQQKTMALYNKAGASPLSGCLPLLLQMPILIAMFSFFPSCIELRGQSFLWVKDLAAPDYICELPFSIPFYGDHVSLFCLLMTVTNIIYTRINMRSQPSQQSMPGMKWMMYLMPLMFLFFFNSYPAALSYYYFLSLLITIVQTYIFRRCVNEEKLRRKMAENAAKPKKKSGFMARLEEAQRQQQARLRQEQQRRQQQRKR